MPPDQTPVVPATPPMSTPPSVQVVSAVCPYCHQPILPTYYFCPNCGTKLNGGELSTSVETQAWIYFFSAILPVICYIMISKWPGIKYFRSKDQKTKSIGAIAIAILTLSTIITFWLAIAWAQSFAQQQTAQIDADMTAPAAINIFKPTFWCVLKE